MPTKRQLTEQALTLSEELGVDVDCSDKLHPELVDLVAALLEKQRLKEAEEAQPSTAPPPPPLPSFDEEPPAPRVTPRTRYPYVVAQGKSFYCARGQLLPGQGVRIDDFDAKTLQKLREEKSILEA